MKKVAMGAIRRYLDNACKHSERFFPLYKDRLNIQKIEWFEYSPHGVWILIKDLKKNLDIDFDYYRYEWNWIKYFDLWKVNIFIRSEWLVDEITKETWNELVEEEYIGQYFSTPYFSFTGKKKGL